MCMKAFIRSGFIYSILIISALVMLCGCSTSKQSRRPEHTGEFVTENGQTDAEDNTDTALPNDFVSIRQYIDKQVRDFRENREQYKVRQADYKLLSEGGTIEGYYSGDKLKYVEVLVQGETVRISYNVYYIDESVVYFVETSVKYDSPISDENGSDIVGETRNEYLIINGRIHEYTSDMKMLNDEDTADYTAKLRDFERTLKNASAAPVRKNAVNTGLDGNGEGADGAGENALELMGEAEGSDAIVPVAVNGLLAGSYINGRWVGARETVAKISDNSDIRYSVYSNFKHVGNGTGSAPFTEKDGRDYISVNIENAVSNDISVAVAIGRTGDVLSAVPKIHGGSFYYDIVVGFLEKRVELENPYCVIQGLTADLDNDGKEEHLISARNYNDSDNLALGGWYREGNNFSYLLLARETGNGYEISVIAEAPRREADVEIANDGADNGSNMMIALREYFVLEMIDIDGDLDLELVCIEYAHNGTSYCVFANDKGQYNQVLTVGS